VERARAPLRGRRRLPRPIREQHEQRPLDAAIGTAPQPYRLIFTLLRETGMGVGEVLELRWGDVTLTAVARRYAFVSRKTAWSARLFRPDRDASHNARVARSGAHTC